MKNIKFYDKNDSFGALANTAALKVKFFLNGHIVDAPSSECIYQSLKGIINPDTSYNKLGQDILNGKHGYARSVQVAGQNFNNSDKIKVFHKRINNMPEELKYYVMYDIIKAKLTQHPILLKAVIEQLNAGNKFVENALTDNYWGIGNGTGQDKLGQIINSVGQELSLEIQKTGKFKVCYSFSSQTISSIKAAGLLTKSIEPKAGDISNQFIDTTFFNNLPNNCTTESKIANFYSDHKNQISNREISVISAINMKELAKKLVDAKQFGNFITKSHNGVKVEYKVQNDKVVVETISKGTFYKIEYSTKTGVITENNISVPISKLGDWAFKIIKSHANTKSNKTTLLPIHNNHGYKDFFEKVIKQEPNCELKIKNGNKFMNVTIQNGQSITVEGVNKYGKPIIVRELKDGSIFENNDKVFHSGYLNWAAGLVELALKEPDQVSVKVVGENNC